MPTLSPRLKSLLERELGKVLVCKRPFTASYYASSMSNTIYEYLLGNYSHLPTHTLHVFHVPRPFSFFPNLAKISDLFHTSYTHIDYNLVTAVKPMDNTPLPFKASMANPIVNPPPPHIVEPVSGVFKSLPSPIPASEAPSSHTLSFTRKDSLVHNTIQTPPLLATQSEERSSRSPQDNVSTADPGAPDKVLFSPFMDKSDQAALKASAPPPAVSPPEAKKNPAAKPRMFKKVHTDDPVSEKEAQRRNAVLQRTPLSGSPAKDNPTQSRIPERSAQYKMTVLLDLDNTLIESVEQKDPRDNSPEGYDFVIHMLHHGKPRIFYTFKRPFVDELLLYLQGRTDVEVMVFTAAKESYAMEIVRHLDTNRTIFQHVFSFNDITRSNEKNIKDLERVGRPIETMCIVDDNRNAYTFQKRSSFPVTSWTSDMKNDTELLNLKKLLEEVVEPEDLVPKLDDFKKHHTSSEYFDKTFRQLA